MKTPASDSPVTSVVGRDAYSPTPAGAPAAAGTPTPAGARDATGARSSGAETSSWWVRWWRYWPRRVGAAEPLAAALVDHHATGRPRRVCAMRADGVAFEIETEEYFTLEGELAELDRLALDRCRGRVLDVGAGSGRHALALEKRGLDVVAIDVSPLCVALCRARGVSDARVFDIMKLGEEKPLGLFDTMLFGMQTIGVAGGVETLEILLTRLRASLAEGGELIVDSSELREAWEEDEADRSPERGEIVLHTRYRGWRGEPFPWLYVSEEDLREIARRADFEMEVIDRVESGEFLASLRPAESATAR